MDVQVGQNAQREVRQWTRPQFTKLGGLSHVKSVCGPDHLPNNPFCQPS